MHCRQRLLSITLLLAFLPMLASVVSSGTILDASRGGHAGETMQCRVTLHMCNGRITSLRLKRFLAAGPALLRLVEPRRTSLATNDAGPLGIYQMAPPTPPPRATERALF